MTGWLNAKQLAVNRIALQLEHERGRQAIAPTPLDILLAQASWHEAHLLRLLKERLAQLTLAAPVIAISLAAVQVEAMAVPNQTLFPALALVALGCVAAVVLALAYAHGRRATVTANHTTAANARPAA